MSAPSSSSSSSAGSPYGGVILDHFRRPRRRGALASANVRGEGANALCGDRVRVELLVDGSTGRVEDAGFVGDACAVCVAAASLLSERVVGSTLDAADRISEGELVALLETPIPDARRACARLPLDAMRAGIAAYRSAPVGADGRAGGGGAA